MRRTLVPEPTEILSGKAGVGTQVCTTLDTGVGGTWPWRNGHKPGVWKWRPEEKRSGRASPRHRGVRGRLKGETEMRKKERSRARGLRGYRGARQVVMAVSHSGNQTEFKFWNSKERLRLRVSWARGMRRGLPAGYKKWARGQDGPHPRSAARQASHCLRQRGDDGSWGRTSTNLWAQATALGKWFRWATGGEGCWSVCREGGGLILPGPTELALHFLFKENH